MINKIELNRLKRLQKFIEESIRIWGPDVFDYSLVYYINSKTPVTLICKKHNCIFELTVSTHLRKQNGCELCAKELKLLILENKRIKFELKFIEFVHTHYPHYDTSKVRYTKGPEPVILHCMIHNVDFEVIPECFQYHRQRCPVCNIEYTKQLDENYRISRENKFKKFLDDNFPEYDYSNMYYVNWETEVTLYCKIHNVEFKVIPDYLKKGSSKCPLCMKDKNDEIKEKERYNKEIEFIEFLHINYPHYDTSKVHYISSDEEVLLYCKIHNIYFTMIPNSLKQFTQQCPECTKEKHINDLELDRQQREKEFIEFLHINYPHYDTSKVYYIKNNLKITLFCKIHNIEFQILPMDITSGKMECPMCHNEIKIEKNEELRIERQKKFIKDSIEVWGPDVFDYSLVYYINNRTPITLICKKHNCIFELMPDVHLKGIGGCEECKIENRNTHFENIKIIYTEQFFNMAKEIHGDKYDYSEVEYQNTNKPVKIFCKKCGKYFMLKPTKHLIGQGCPYCNESKLEDKVKRILDSRNINYTVQKTFEWLKYKAKQKLDFYLPDYNIAIECLGDLHFRPVYFGKNKDGGNYKQKMFEEFELNQARDANKKKLCEEHNVPIIYIANKEYCNGIDIFEISELLNQIELYTKQKIG